MSEGVWLVIGWSCVFCPSLVSQSGRFMWLPIWGFTLFYLSRLDWSAQLYVFGWSCLWGMRWKHERWSVGGCMHRSEARRHLRVAFLLCWSCSETEIQAKRSLEMHHIINATQNTNGVYSGLLYPKWRLLKTANSDAFIWCCKCRPWNHQVWGRKGGACLSIWRRTGTNKNYLDTFMVRRQWKCTVLLFIHVQLFMPTSTHNNHHPVSSECQTFFWEPVTGAFLHFASAARLAADYSAPSDLAVRVTLNALTACRPGCIHMCQFVDVFACVWVCFECTQKKVCGVCFSCCHVGEEVELYCAIRAVSLQAGPAIWTHGARSPAQTSLVFQSLSVLSDLASFCCLSTMINCTSTITLSLSLSLSLLFVSFICLCISLSLLISPHISLS